MKTQIVHYTNNHSFRYTQKYLKARKYYPLFLNTLNKMLATFPHFNTIVKYKQEQNFKYSINDIVSITYSNDKIVVNISPNSTRIIENIILQFDVSNTTIARLNNFLYGISFSYGTLLVGDFISYNGDIELLLQQNSSSIQYHRLFKYSHVIKYFLHLF